MRSILYLLRPQSLLIPCCPLAELHGLMASISGVAWRLCAPLLGGLGVPVLRRLRFVIEESQHVSGYIILQNY